MRREARRYFISGRVQGVGFRFFAEAAGIRSGLVGWVRNLPDGRVEIFAQGDANDLQSFERQIHRGPSGARVSTVDVSEAAPGDITGFDIR
jgi:acylphosphatase